MAIVFNEGAVKDCEPPCVAQTFIPHDAVLFKIFVIGSKYFVVERPSLKNFYAAGKYRNAYFLTMAYFSRSFSLFLFRMSAIVAIVLHPNSITDRLLPFLRK